jgi:transcriptional regulator with XRE-family HTH domain
MKVEEVVGKRLAKARHEAGLTQAELGAELEPYLGAPWSKKVVSAAENGRRVFTATELLALGRVLLQEVGFFFVLEPSEHFEFPGGETMGIEELLAATWESTARLGVVPEMQASAKSLEHLSAELDKHIKDLYRRMKAIQKVRITREAPK